jgi:hypothetical protein
MWAWCLHTPRVKFNTGEMEMIFTTVRAVLGVLILFFGVSCHAGDVIVVGASDASANWPIVRNSVTNRETNASQNALIGGQYQGLCSALSRTLAWGTHVRCPAVAGAMSDTMAFDWAGARILWPGYDAQFTQGVRESRSNGTLLATWLVITLANDGPNAIEPTMRLIDRAHAAGLNVIVEAYPAWAAFSASQQRDQAILKHGAFFGSLLQASLTTLPTREEYETLAQGHRLALEHYPGVNAYLDFYPGGRPKDTLDGVHVRPYMQMRAANLIKGIVEPK